MFGQGNGADCRNHVQRLNSHRGELEQARDHVQTVLASAAKMDYSREVCGSQDIVEDPRERVRLFDRHYNTCKMFFGVFFFFRE